VFGLGRDAGVAKMLPNTGDDAARLEALADAVKLVFASTYFRAARESLRASGRTPREDEMAVIIQDVVGAAAGPRFYPAVSGEGRSLDMYPALGAAREQGVVSLAVGLGKTIAEGGMAWTYSPARPAAHAAYGSVSALMSNTQTQFWYIDLRGPSTPDATKVDEHLATADLATAEADGVLGLAASTYDAQSDVVRPGIARPGARIVDFAPTLELKELPLNDVVGGLLKLGVAALVGDAEISFALDAVAKPARLGLLNLRPQSLTDDTVEIIDHRFEDPNVLVASSQVMGNGIREDIADIVYVRPDAFEPRLTRRIAADIGVFNRRLKEQRRDYLLVGFGRWGSSDPWLGIPAEWRSIDGAKVIVESTRPDMNVEASRGLHFYHHVRNGRVAYLNVKHGSKPGIDWEFLAGRKAVDETDHIRHVRLDRPLTVKVDGRNGRAGIWYRV